MPTPTFFAHRRCQTLTPAIATHRFDVNFHGRLVIAYP
jgi:hypothetical protein